MTNKAGPHTCLETLLKRGVDVNVHDKDGRTALIEAARDGHEKCVEVFITAGADVNVQNNDGSYSSDRSSSRGS